MRQVKWRKNIYNLKTIFYRLRIPTSKLPVLYPVTNLLKQQHRCHSKECQQKPICRRHVHLNLIHVPQSPTGKHVLS